MLNLQKCCKLLFIGIIILLPVFLISINAMASGGEQNVFLDSDEAQATGRIIYQPSPRQATVKLYNSSNAIVDSQNTNDDGYYTLNAPAGSGYTLVVTKPGYLSFTLKELTIADGADIETIDMMQMGGDIDGDGYINSVDLVCLISEFGRTPINYPLADIDGDGFVNSVDLTIMLAGYGKWNMEKIADPISTNPMPTQITINAVTGATYDITISASGITSFSGMEIKFSYDAAVFDVVDICAFTKNKEISAGPIAFAGITVTQASPGMVRFTVSKTVPAGKQWAGALTTIRLKAKTTATSVVNVEK